jgi:DNA-binding IscR family transcriptional regulator
VLRISRLTDYGTVVLAHLARDKADLVSAAEVASGTGIALPTVSKLLKALDA